MMKIKRKNAVYIRRGRRIWFYDVVQGSTATSVMTTTLRRRKRPNTKKYWSHSAENPSQDLSLHRLSAPIQSSNIIYPSLSYRRLSLRKSKTSRTRPRKASTATPTRLPTRFPNDVLAAYKASCMRKTRRNSPLNVGELQITSTHIHFTAHYLNSAPSDANISLPFGDIVHIRRACYRRVLPHGVLIRCDGFPDYLMVLADRTQQADVLEVLGNAMRNTPTVRSPLPSTSERLFAYDSGSSGEVCFSGRASIEQEIVPNGVVEEASSRGSSQQRSRYDNSVQRFDDISASQKQPDTYPSADKVTVHSLEVVAAAARSESRGMHLLAKGTERVKDLANGLIYTEERVDDFTEASVLLVSSVLLLVVTLSVVVAISYLCARVRTLSSAILEGL